MAILCISCDKKDIEKITKFFKKKAEKKHMGFLVFTNEKDFIEQNALQKMENSYVMFDDFGSLLPSDSIIDFFAQSESKNRNIIYFDDFLKHPTIYAMTDFFVISRPVKGTKKMRLAFFQNPLWKNIIRKDTFIKHTYFDENGEVIRNVRRKRPRASR